MTPDIVRVAALIREVAAAEILPRFRKLATEDVREKRPGNLVTTADLVSEARFVNELPGLAPGSTVVAEEMAEADPAGVLARLGEEAPVWVVDPVDGTANFAAGKPDFAVIVAYVDRGRTRAGWIYEPVEDAMTTAEAGAGAYQDGRRIAVAAAAPLAEMSGSLGWKLRHNKQVSARVGRPVNLACSGREHVAMATGRIHFALYRRSLPWDHAAGVLIHREAGGYSAALDGAPYRPDGGPEQGVLLAPDRASWRALHDLAMPALRR